jgi:hypothetical protein
MKNKKNVFDKKTEEILAKSFAKHNLKLGIRREVPDYLKISFAKKVEKLGNKASFFNINWKIYSASIVSAASVGFVIARLTLIPAEIGIKGLESNYSQNQTYEATKVIELKSQDIKGQSLEIIQKGLDAHLEVKSQMIGSKYQIFINALSSNNNKLEQQLKKTLNLDDNFSGSVTVIISKK